MSMPLGERRSERNRPPVRSYADEQALHRFNAEAAVEVRRAVRAVAATIEASDTEEEELPYNDRDDSSDDEKATSEDENVAPWTSVIKDIHLPACTASPTVVLPRHGLLTELDFLQCFLDPVMIDLFVTNTNLYAAARQAAAWVPVTTEEMWRYLGIRIRQGIVVLPELHHYWEADYRDSYCSQSMSRNRFCQLHRYFHIEAPLPREQRQTIVQKTHTFYHQCQRLFHAYYVPGRDFAVDETMVRFQGRSSWITVIKGKPEPIGYKLYTVASEGYLLGFRIYRGKGGYNTAQNVLHHTVMDLVLPWQGHHRILYMDNLYTSPALCHALLGVGIRSCGTCRPNRADLPPNLTTFKASLAKGQTKTWQSGQLGCLIWHDSKPVLFLSTHLRPDKITPLDPSPFRPATFRPTVAVDYNLNKGHVDQVDQVRSYHAVQRRGRRSWPALAWWLLDMCITNAHRLCDIQHSKVTEVLDFREKLLTQIAALYPSPRTPVQPTVAASAQSRYVGHWPVHHGTPHVCAHCSGGKQHRRRTSYKCAVCGKFLHPAPCFGAYHDRLHIDNRTL